MHMAIAPQQRLDDYRLDERNATDGIATVISLHLYGRQYDELPVALKGRVVGAALRSIRSTQPAWMAEAQRRAVENINRAMAEEMGPAFGMLAPRQREALARIGVQAVAAALIGVFEIADPFHGAGDALKVYDAADAALREVK